MSTIISHQSSQKNDALAGGVYDINLLDGLSDDYAEPGKVSRAITKHHDWYRERHKILSSLSHILVLILLAGIVATPLVSLWSYKFFSDTRGRVLGETTRALEEFEGARLKLQEFDLTGSQEHFLKSYQAFINIESELNHAGKLAGVIAALVPKGQTYYNLLQVGKNISQAGYLLSGLDLTIIEQILQNRNLTNNLQIITSHLNEARPLLIAASNDIQFVNLDDLPEEQRGEIAELKSVLQLVALKIDDSIALLENLLLLLGTTDWQRYLVLFQNNLEMRPTGGFISAAALMDIYQGKLKYVEVPSGGAYDYNYGLYEKILAPKPLQILTLDWEFQDCNWFADGPASAEQCSRFLEKSTGSSVDGVITVNLPFVIELLKINGPIEMNEYDVTITADNFIPFVQSLVESKEARASGAPKQILADLSEILVNKLPELLQSPQLAFQVIQLLNQSLKAKDLLIYAKDEDLQLWLEERDWSGALSQSFSGDYLHVNVATVNGGKSDLYIRQSINHQVTVNAVGELFGTVEVKREHLGERRPPEAFETQAERDFNYLTTQPNLSYIQVYVPQGSELIQVTGDLTDVSQLISRIDRSEYKVDDYLMKIVQDPYILDNGYDTRISEEYQKTVFGNYLLVNPSSSGHIIFRYKLPFKLNDLASEYKLLVEKQPASQSHFTSRFEDKLLYNGQLDQDLVID